MMKCCNAHHYIAVMGLHRHRVIICAIACIGRQSKRNGRFWRQQFFLQNANMTEEDLLNKLRGEQVAEITRAYNADVSVHKYIQLTSLVKTLGNFSHLLLWRAIHRQDTLCSTNTREYAFGKW